MLENILKSKLAMISCLQRVNLHLNLAMSR